MTDKRGAHDDSAGYTLLMIGPDVAATVNLPEKGTVLIGRDESATIRIVDPLASRNHARLYVGERIEIEDLESANGTVVRDKRLGPGERAALVPGESVTIGSTALIVHRRAPPIKPRRVWPHGYFETRLIEECARAESAHGSLGLVRVHVGSNAPAAQATDILVSFLRPGDVLAAYAPGEYELLLVDTDPPQATVLGKQILAALEGQGITSRYGLALFRADGISPQALVARACSLVRESKGPDSAPAGVVLENPAMKELYALAKRVAVGTINVLILGETGVGKEVFAETIHRLSARKAGPFISLNCAALSESLLESELFGYEKGAFTGATQAKEGLLQAASGGTLFLDEIGEMALPLQAKLLRAIEARQILRVGSTKVRSIDVRFVAATNRDLEEEVAIKQFREDLFFRLNGVTLSIPPLRERQDEIESLVRLFLGNVASQVGRPVPSLSSAALEAMKRYSWPGNIRELRNVVERALLLASEGEIGLEHLPVQKMLRISSRPLRTSDEKVQGASAVVSLQDMERQAILGAATSLQDMERHAILDALARCAGNQTRAAELLGIPRRTFCTRLMEYNVPRPRRRAPHDA